MQDCLKFWITWSLDEIFSPLKKLLFFEWIVATIGKFTCNIKGQSKMLLLSLISKARQTFGDQVLMFNLCCCYGQLAPFPAATCRPLMKLTVKFAVLQERKVAHGNTKILSPKVCYQSSVMPYSTDNRRTLL